VGELAGRPSCGVVLYAASSVYPSSREGRVGSRLEEPVQIDIVTFVQCSGLIQTDPISIVRIVNINGRRRGTRDNVTTCATDTPR
jgi:hypothetical protein